MKSRSLPAAALGIVIAICALPLAACGGTDEEARAERRA